MFRYALPALLLVTLMLTGCPFEKEEKVVEIAPRPFAMPTITGKSLEEAQAICTDWDMSLAVLEERFDHSIAKGTVISQWPHCGDEAVEGLTAVVVVSKKPEMVRIPNLHNLTVQQAERKLKDVGLYVHVRKAYRYNEAIAKDRVLDFDPGQRVFEGSEVQLLLSKGPMPTGGVNTMRLAD